MEVLKELSVRKKHVILFQQAIEQVSALTKCSPYRNYRLLSMEELKYLKYLHHFKRDSKRSTFKVLLFAYLFFFTVFVLAKYW